MREEFEPMLNFLDKVGEAICIAEMWIEWKNKRRQRTVIASADGIG